MTRANINFIWQEWGKAPHTLFFYWNGDQYPSGIRDYYHLLDFVEGEWTAENFTNWIKANYHDDDGNASEPEDLGEGGQPKVYYTDGFITDYSYVFDASGGRVLVYEWAELIFKGNKQEFIEWLKNRHIG